MKSETPARRTPDSGLGACLRRGYDRHLKTMARLPGEPLARLEELVLLVHRTIESGGKLLVCGNGGSAADAQHLASELVGRYKEERRGLPAVSLAADGSVLTCLLNDYGPDHVFARQVQALGRAGDLLIGISTSGRSPNILRAFETARGMGLQTAALLGRDGGPAASACALAIVVPDEETARIQECHGLMIHLLAEGLDQLLAEGAGRGPSSGTAPREVSR